MSNDLPKNDKAVTHNGKGTDFSAHTQGFDNNPDEIFDAMSAEMRDEIRSGQEYPLLPIMPPQGEQTEQHPQGEQTATPGQQHQANEETPTGTHGFDFSLMETPGTPPDDVRELPIWGLPLSFC